MRTKIHRISFSGVAVNTVLILICATCIVPILAVLSISLSDEADIIANGYSLIPKNISLEGYKTIFKNSTNIWTAYRTTLALTIIGSPLGTMVCALFAYTLSRKDFFFRKPLSFFMTFSMLFSGGLIPTYILITKYLHLGDTLAVLLIPGLANVWYIFLLKFFFDGIPSSLIEAAKLDGAGEGTIFFRVMLPLAKTGLVTILLFYALSFWGAWQGSLYYITSEEKYQLQYLLSKMMNNIDFVTKNVNNLPDGVSVKDLPKESTRMAMCLVTAGPMLVVFPFFQKYFVKGITVGSVKG